MLPFPLECRDIRRVPYLPDPHYLLVLEGQSSPPERPLFSWEKTICNAQVDYQGWWGPHEWSLLPQLYDCNSPWLAFLPIHHDRHHISRQDITRDMIVDAPRLDSSYRAKQPLLFAPGPELKERLRSYVDHAVEQAKAVLECLKSDRNGKGKEHAAWPTGANERATYLFRQLLAGVPSVNAFRRALTCLRRATGELEAFAIWGNILRERGEQRSSNLKTYRSERNVDFRGVYLHGDREQWLEEGSDVRRVYREVKEWGVPVYALVKGMDWDITPFMALGKSISPLPRAEAIQEREERQLPFYCYPPKVDGTTFERAARGLAHHDEEGKKGEIERLRGLDSRRQKTQVEQSNASKAPSNWHKVVGPDKRAHPEVQARVNPKHGPPPFMPYWKLSDPLAMHTPEHLSVNAGKGTFLPRPSAIWGIEGPRKITSLETLTAIWKLLVLRPCLFKRGDLTVEQAYLKAQDWRDILNRAASDTRMSTLWTNGKPELWGSRLQVSVQQRVAQIVGEPTLKKMDCYMRCSPVGRFSIENDPHRHLEQLVLVRLTELHVLHDFASYHPALQHTINGRWCPPPFDADEALEDRPGAFEDLCADVSEAEKRAMDDILRVVRWNGPDGARAWQMEDGDSYRRWLGSFRSLLNGCPNAWVNNPELERLTSTHPEWDPLTCDLGQADAPIRRVARLLVSTHLLLTLRVGRLPWLWFDKPVLDHLACSHDNL
ncbi:unnamed protein product [Peniophora sp. CBMAI 1063]|nr:unnamed protein product [Peniophora sp. CBMAI 1063]